MICTLFRKPLLGNTLSTLPTGVLAIDACRVATSEVGIARPEGRREDRENWRITGGSSGSGATSPLGRFPANIVVCRVAKAELDRQSGVSSSSGGTIVRQTTDQSTGWHMRNRTEGIRICDTGGASRFFKELV